MVWERGLPTIGHHGAKALSNNFRGFCTTGSILHGVGRRPAPWGVLLSFKQHNRRFTHMPLLWLPMGFGQEEIVLPWVPGKTLNCCTTRRPS